MPRCVFLGEGGVIFPPPNWSCLGQAKAYRFKMAGSQLPVNEKMAVYNSVDQRAEDQENKDSSVDELEINHPRNISQKLKAMDPIAKKKSSFVITGVVVAKPTADRVLNEECDSYDDVDETCETHTEDVSSDILDLSKNTDIEPDPSSTEDVSPNLEDPPRDPRISDMTSRFKLVKIETREPFKRGRWTCLDFLDPPAEKLDKGVEEAGSGNSSAASSIHYVPGVDDPSKNPLGGATIVFTEAYQIMEPQPILPTVTPTSIVGVLQNGEYNPASLVQPGQSGVGMPIHDNVSMPAQVVDPSPSQPPQQGALASQSQPIPPPSQPSTLPAPPHMSSQQHDYAQNTPSYSDQPPQASSQQQQPSNGHIPSGILNQSNIKKPPQQAVGGAPQGSMLPSHAMVATKCTGTDTQNPPPGEYVQQGQDFITRPPAQDGYLQSSGQEYLSSTGQEFLPPQQTDFASAPSATANDVSAPLSLPNDCVQPPNIQQSTPNEFPSGKPQQSHANTSAPKSITAPSSTTQAVADFNNSQAVKPAIDNLVISTSGGSTGASPNSENVQSGGELGGVEAPTGESVSKPLKPVEPVAVADSEEESKVAAATPSTGKVTLTPQSILTPPLLEMVSATMNAGAMHQSKEDGDESGASTVAIDNKIEQAMDLVKSHLMFAVREEVEVLKEQIKELLEKNSQLECENSILKAAATPDTITKVKQQQQQQQQAQQQQQQQPPASSSSS